MSKDGEVPSSLQKPTDRFLVNLPLVTPGSFLNTATPPCIDGLEPNPFEKSFQMTDSYTPFFDRQASKDQAPRELGGPKDSSPPSPPNPPSLPLPSPSLGPQPTPPIGTVSAGASPITAAQPAHPFKIPFLPTPNPPERDDGLVKGKAGSQALPPLLSSEALSSELNYKQTYGGLIKARSNSIDLLTAASEIERKSLSVPGSPTLTPSLSGASPMLFTVSTLSEPNSSANSPTRTTPLLLPKADDKPGNLTHSPGSLTPTRHTPLQLQLHQQQYQQLQQLQQLQQQQEVLGKEHSMSPDEGSGSEPPEDGRKRRKSQDGGSTEEEKRLRFLERNRKAAQKCRQKKKDMIDKLQKETADLEKMYHQLLREVDIAKSINGQMVAMLNEHKNCPHNPQSRTFGS